jgi:PAS domain S-box-containing protein
VDSLKVLIVDDNEPVRRGIRTLMTMCPHATVCGEAGDGLGGLMKARTLKPDLVIMDISMPRMDGIEATEVLRKELPDTRIIIISQNDPALVATQVARSGAHAYIAKNQLGQKLLPTIEEVANRGREADNPTAITPAATSTAQNERIFREMLDALPTAIVSSSDDAIVSKNLNGVITSWNKSAERIFGYTAHEAIGQNITMVIPPERRDEEVEILARLSRGERIEHFDTVRRRKDGSLIDVSLTVSPIRNASGQIVGASKVARDIGERIRSEKALRESEDRERRILAESVAANAKFRAVFEQTTVFAGIMTTAGVVIDINKLSLEACGYRAEDVLGKQFWDTGWWRNHKESRDKIRASTPMVAQGVPYREILEYAWADGTPRLVDFALYPIVDEQNGVLFLHPTGVDITDQKQTEENFRKLAESLDVEVRARTRELESRNVEVVRQSELVREFSRRLLQAQDAERRHIARELHDSAGQTLAVLNMDVALFVQKVGEVSPELGAAAAKIENTVRQLQREIRTTSYLLHPPLLDEAGLKSALSWYVQGLTERSELQIDVTISENFGRLPRDMELVIFRVVQESLTNIHRHSGSKTARIELSRKQREIRLEIRDQGKGMSPERLADIESGASGVGTRGMRERVRQFDGKIQFESNGSGTKVLVTFPVPKAEPEDESEPSIHPIRASV